MNVRNPYRGPGGGGPRGPQGPQGPQESGAVRETVAKVPVLLDKDKDPNGQILVESADQLGLHLVGNKMTTAQIRKLYSEVKKIDFKDGGPYKVNMIRAKLAYTAGRHSEVEDLQKVLDKALKEVGTDEQKFNRFLDFFEAVVAYHKKHGGRE